MHSALWTESFASKPRTSTITTHGRNSKPLLLRDLEPTTTKMDDNSIPVQVLVLTRDTGWYCPVDLRLQTKGMKVVTHKQLELRALAPEARKITQGDATALPIVRDALSEGIWTSTIQPRKSGAHSRHTTTRRSCSLPARKRDHLVRN